MSNNKNYIELSPMLYNLGIERKYKKDVLRLTHNLIKDTKKAIQKIMKSDMFSEDETPYTVESELKRIKKKYLKNVNTIGKMYAIKMIREQLRYATFTLRKAILEDKELKKILEETEEDDDILYGYARVYNLQKGSTTPHIETMEKPFQSLKGKLKDIVRSVFIQNMTYLDDIGRKFLNDVTASVMRNSTTGSKNDLNDDFRRISEQTDRRARLIAEDQARKAFTAISIENMKQKGIKYWKWVYTYRAKEPREYHKDVLNGEIFSFDDDPPIIDPKTGQRGYPADLPYCHCVMRPIIK